ncbi:MAG: PAC2 family protein, partial [Microbacteriaceae bacterium]
DVPHTRPISIFSSSEDAEVREALDLTRSSYEGPVGILSVLAESAKEHNIPSMSIWASVPHYVHHSPSPKASLALTQKLEELLSIKLDNSDLVLESEKWESSIDTMSQDDEELTQYIRQLEKARDMVDSPEASGEAIAEEFEKYLRLKDDDDPRKDGHRRGPEA